MITLREPMAATDKNIVALFDHLGMGTLLEFCNSLEAEICVESIKPGDNDQPLDWATAVLNEGSEDQPEIFGKCVDKKKTISGQPLFPATAVLDVAVSWSIQRNLIQTLNTKG